MNTEISTVTQKSIASFLDAAAARAESLGDAPATSKQVWFLAGLMLQAGKDASDMGYDASTAILSKKEASAAIEYYLKH